MGPRALTALNVWHVRTPSHHQATPQSLAQQEETPGPSSTLPQPRPLSLGKKCSLKAAGTPGGLRDKLW